MDAESDTPRDSELGTRDCLVCETSDEVEQAQGHNGLERLSECNILCSLLVFGYVYSLASALILSTLED
jgi:hypothetical protein